MNTQCKRLFSLLLSLLLIFSLTACNAESGDDDKKDVPVMEAYYNLDGHKYNSSGTSSRPAEADGTYTIRLAYKGKLVTKTVKADEKLINKIDSQTVLGFQFDDGGVITGDMSIKEMGGKIVAERCYVQSVDDGKVTVNPQSDFSGESETLKISEKRTTITSVVYGVTSLSELSVNDQIIAVKDGSGTITDVFVLVSPSAEPPVMEAYWNVDGAKYNAGGVSSRPAQADGTYKVRFTQKARLMTLTVKGDQKLINKIDSMRILGLVKDENGIVTDVKTVEEMGGQIVYDGYYVSSSSTFMISVNSNATLDGVEIEVPTPSKSCYIVNLVTEPDSPIRAYGSDIIRGDRIVAVQDYNGVITDIFFYQAGLIRSGKDQYCPHCCEEGETVHFDALTQDIRPGAEGGHYFLFEDWELVDMCSLYENVELVIDLYGYTIFNENPNKRLLTPFNDNTYFGIMDTSEAKTGKIVNDHNPQEQNGTGAAVWANKGTFELFGGTIDASRCVSAGNGAAVHVSSGATFIMHEGAVILGGTTIANMVAADGHAISGGGLGGAVYCGGNFIMYGGRIEGGKAISNGTDRGRGGCIALVGNAVFTMYDGEIIGGYADNPDFGASEGLMYQTRTATFHHYGGTLTER